MNKSELIEALSAETGFNKKDIATVLDLLRRKIITALSSGDRVQWAKFGTFTLARRGARKGINPQTKESMDLPEVLVPRFKAGKSLRGVLNTEKK
jgi:DNA-binding protein HU-beta